jgi:hypothetical protein
MSSGRQWTAFPASRSRTSAPELPAPGTALQAYVSAGVRGIAVRIAGGAAVERTPIDIADLPRGLTMLMGESIDEAEYEKGQA